MEMKKNIPTLDLILHISLSLACATIVTILFIITQCRQSFQTKREESISTIRQINATKEKAKASKKKKTGTDEADGGDDELFVIGFFHPHCSAGGGGERVLWKIIEALGELKEGKMMSGGKKRREKKSSKGGVDVVGDLDECNSQKLKQLSVIVYTVDEPSESFQKDLFEHVRDRFSIDIPPSLSINFVHLHEVKYLLEKPRRLTMIMESLGTMQLAWNALHTITPHVFIDTTGCAFTFIVAKILAGCKIGTYVHYPTISTDMLSLVWERRPTYNNTSDITTNPIITYVKLIYYFIFAICYGFAGSLADLTMVNSNWTKVHIQSLWKLARGGIHVVFPPVNTKVLESMPLSDPPRENLILSIGQFRPEKDHILQLKSFALLLEKNDGEMKKSKVKLILIGSCRGDDDYERVDQLKGLANELGIQDHVEFVLNQPYSVLHDYLGKASLGIHTMWNEHFGIGVVEMMAAGLVTVAHDSGGPKSDIIVNPWDLKAPHKSLSNSNATGLLASQKEEYATAMYEVLKKGPLSEDMLKVRQNGRKASKRFSDEVFMDAFKEVFLLSSLLK